MPIRKRPPSPTEEAGELLDLPLDHVPGGEPEPSRPAPARDDEPSPASGTSPRRPISRKTQRRGLGDVDTIGSLERRRPRRRSASWLWLVVLLAVPLSGLVGYLLKTDPPVAALSADLLDFGAVRLGAEGIEQTLRVTNQGEQALLLTAPVVSGPAAAEFRVAADGCTGREISAQTECAVRLAFAPAGPGARKAQIRLDTNTPDGAQAVPLIGVGVTPELTVEPSELDLGAQDVGSTGAPATVRVGNRGTAPLQLGRIELGGPAAADFRTVADGCSSRLLEPGGRCSLRFAFAPTGAGQRRAELSIESDAGAPRTVRLEGRATRRTPRLRLEASQLEFEPLPLTATDGSRQTLTLSNDGNGPMTVRGLRVAADPQAPASQAAFEVTTESCTAGEVPAGGSCEIEVGFRPGAEGEARAALEIDSSATPEPYRIVLSGAGITPRAAITPARLAFGEVAAKASSGPRAVRVANPGSDLLRIGTVRVTGADAAAFTAGECAGAAIAPGAECRLQVVFRPGRAGPHRADLQVAHNAGGGRHVVPLIGIGVAARLSLDRGNLDFGEVPTGAEARRQLTLTNAGRSDLKILRLRLTGRLGDFELDAAGCVAERASGTTASGATLGPNASCTVTVIFRPTSAGSQRLQLVIDHSAAATAREVPIIARATAPPEPAIELAPARVDFPDRRVGDRSTIKTVTVSNPGTARLSLTAASIGGEHAGDFQLVPGSCASFVAPGASCTMGVRFVPAAAGLRSALLSIRHDAAGGAAEIKLSGTAPQ